MSSKEKIVTLRILKRRLPSHRRTGKEIAFTNGCFDILHFGHTAYLEKAKREDRVLIVGLNSDRSVRALKGKGRPIYPQNVRAAVLAALGSVDYVIIFDQTTPLELIKALKPDVLIKGADWKGRPVAGEDVVKENGGLVEFIRFEPGYSTTNLIRTIKQRG